jgi:hypothetical protein
MIPFRYTQAGTFWFLETTIGGMEVQFGPFPSLVAVRYVADALNAEITALLYSRLGKPANVLYRQWQESPPVVADVEVTP